MLNEVRRKPEKPRMRTLAPNFYWVSCGRITSYGKTAKAAYVKWAEEALEISPNR